MAKAPTREELYELVWSDPVSKVAAKLGLSDVGLAKRCRREDIPVPPRGYWAKIAAGHAQDRPALPPPPAPIPPKIKGPPRAVPKQNTEAKQRKPELRPPPIKRNRWKDRLSRDDKLESF
jgi:hypothetical protein